MSLTKLIVMKSCPFCGGEAMVRTIQRHGDPIVYFAQCTECGAKKGAATIFNVPSDIREYMSSLQLEEWQVTSVKQQWDVRIK